ncbi:hypothetical protein, partial [Achromobacter sp. GbtcB20]|uniref:hypothetical protein n=1 Tax=Achromobacter sp. GbtcB20 TaxID=2824765 RepID=UPI001C3022FB
RIENAVSGCSKGNAAKGMQDRNLLKPPSRLAPRGGFVFGVVRDLCAARVLRAIAVWDLR